MDKPKLRIESDGKDVHIWLGGKKVIEDATIDVIDCRRELDNLMVYCIYEKPKTDDNMSESERKYFKQVFRLFDKVI